jgi:hypothetical protein
MKKLPKDKDKNSPYHKTVSAMTATEEAAELLMVIAPLLRVASPAAIKILFSALRKGIWKEVSIDEIDTKKTPKKKR